MFLISEVPLWQRRPEELSCERGTPVAEETLQELRDNMKGRWAEDLKQFEDADSSASESDILASKSRGDSSSEVC
jgi:hypothetical protein